MYEQILAPPPTSGSACLEERGVPLEDNKKDDAALFLALAI